MVTKKATPDAQERRARKVFELLYELCVTDEARNSLCVGLPNPLFLALSPSSPAARPSSSCRQSRALPALTQSQLFARTYGRIHNMPSILWSTVSVAKAQAENKKFTPSPSPSASLMTEKKLGGEGAPRKMSFMERLMGRNRKTSGQSSSSEKSSGR